MKTEKDEHNSYLGFIKTATFFCNLEEMLLLQLHDPFVDVLMKFILTKYFVKFQKYESKGNKVKEG